MLTLLWDASALVKRYVEEQGTQTVLALFEGAPARAMVCTTLGYVETYSILVRRRNSGILRSASLGKALWSLRHEMLESPETQILSVDDLAVLASVAWIARHNVNSADAVILETYLRFAQAGAAEHMLSLLVTADQRLLRAAEAEGLSTLNPESVSPQEALSLLAREQNPRP